MEEIPDAGQFPGSKAFKEASILSVVASLLFVGGDCLLAGGMGPVPVGGKHVSHPVHSRCRLSPKR